MKNESLYFKLKKSRGTEFEAIFTELMKEKYKSNYKRVQHYSSEGDMKVDGILNNRIYFALYAPESTNGLEEKLIYKLKKDYYGFLEKRKDGKWQSVEEWFFTFNIDRPGVPPELMNEFLSIKKSSDFEVNIWTFDDIFNEIKSSLNDKPEFNDISKLNNNINSLCDFYENMNRKLSKYDISDYNQKWKMIEQDEKLIIYIVNSLYNHLNKISKIARKNIYYLKQIKCWKYIQELIELTPDIYENSESFISSTLLNTIPQFLDSAKHDKRIKCCEKIIDKLEDELKYL